MTGNYQKNVSRLVGFSQIQRLTAFMGVYVVLSIGLAGAGLASSRQRKMSS